MSISHIAGPYMTIGSHRIQRCCICGEELIMMDLRNIATPDGQKNDFSRGWPEQRLVRISGNQSVLLDDTSKLPEDSCFNTIIEE